MLSRGRTFGFELPSKPVVVKKLYYALKVKKLYYALKDVYPGYEEKKKVLQTLNQLYPVAESTIRGSLSTPMWLSSGIVHCDVT